MPQRSNDFQKLVALINGCIRQGAQVTESALLIDKVTGQRREVDILISHTVAEYPVNIAIEVIDRKRKADDTWVGSMHEKHQYLNTNKLILVSKSGFYKPAIAKAKYLNIDIITFKEALSTDWKLALQLYSSGYLILTSLNYRCAAVCGSDLNKKTFSPVSRKTTVFSPTAHAPLMTLQSTYCLIRASRKSFALI